MKHLPDLLGVVVLAALTSGCLLTARARTQPVDVYYATSSEVYVSEPMPAPRFEVVQAVAPAPGHLWVSGHWQWGGGGYVWAPGRWARPSHPGYVWTAPRYENRRDRHVYVHGSWGPRAGRAHDNARHPAPPAVGRGRRRGPPPPAYRVN